MSARHTRQTTLRLALAVPVGDLAAHNTVRDRRPIARLDGYGGFGFYYLTRNGVALFDFEGEERRVLLAPVDIHVVQIARDDRTDQGYFERMYVR